MNSKPADSLTAVDFGRMLLSAKIEPMSEQLAEIWLTLMLGGKLSREKNKGVLGFPYLVLDKRLAHHGLTMEEDAKTFVVFLTRGNPGSLVMWCAVVKALEPRQVNLATLADVFPMGFPTESEMQRVWKAQKCANGSNRLDHAGAW